MAIQAAAIPSSSSTVDVSIIDTTTYIYDIPADICLTPIIPGLEKWNGPSYSFLIHHPPSDTRLLFDLGIPKDDTKTLAPDLVKAIRETYGISWTVEKDVSEILTEHDVDPSSVDAVIYSHHHWDHVGDITTFPTSTEILVGPGFKDKYLPGWPDDPENISFRSIILQDRKSSEFDFSDTAAHVCEIGGFQALDYFRDGSFYVLNTPGHTTGHISALARTTTTTTAQGESEESTFIFMGGDITHHCLNFRPSDLKPLPREITPNPYAPIDPTTESSQTKTHPPSCPAEIFTRLHRLHDPNSSATSTQLPPSHTQPFCFAHGDDFSVQSQDTTDHLLRFDGMPNVFTVFAHDDSLRDVLEFFPRKANEWKRRGWGEKGHWRFLRDLVQEK